MQNLTTTKLPWNGSVSKESKRNGGEREETTRTEREAEARRWMKDAREEENRQTQRQQEQERKMKEKVEEAEEASE